jgi:hypothetical protein
LKANGEIRSVLKQRSNPIVLARVKGLQSKLHQSRREQLPEHEWEESEENQEEQQRASLPSIASAKNADEGTICALRDSIVYFILHE